MSLTFDNDEQDVLASFERDEWQSVPDLVRELEQYRQYAAAMNARNRSVHIQLAADDFDILHQHAQAAGLSRETLIEHIVHRYIAGELVERP